MKKFVLTIMILSITSLAFSQQVVSKYMDKYESDETFTKVSVSSKMFSLFSEMEGGEEDEKLFYDITSKLKGMKVIASEKVSSPKAMYDGAVSDVEKAGFEEIKFQFEPVAAALAFEKNLNISEEKNILIGDFGGGTSDFTIVKFDGSSLKRGVNRKEDVLALGGVSVGGDTFDSQIMWGKLLKYFGGNIKYKSMAGKTLGMPIHIMKNLCEWHIISQLKDRKTREFIKKIKTTADDKTAVKNLENLIEDNYGFMLFQSIEKAKIELSEHQESQIIFEEQKLHIEEALSRNEFESIITEEVEKIKECLNSVLAQSTLKEEDIDLVFLTGGSSYIPCIRSMFTEKFGSDKIKQTNAFTSVAYGLGISSLYDFD